MSWQLTLWLQLKMDTAARSSVQSLYSGQSSFSFISFETFHDICKPIWWSYDFRRRHVFEGNNMTSNSVIYNEMESESEKAV
jgi:hypothetical protein